MRGAVNLLHGLRKSFNCAYKNANLHYKLFMKDLFCENTHEIVKRTISLHFSKYKKRTKSSNERLVYTSQK